VTLARANGTSTRPYPVDTTYSTSAGESAPPPSASAITAAAVPGPSGDAGTTCQAAMRPSTIITAFALAEPMSMPATIIATKNTWPNLPQRPPSTQRPAPVSLRSPRALRFRFAR